MAHVLSWVCRIVTILFILFISLFALDAFETEGSIAVKIAAFAVHLTPSMLLVAVLVLAWNWPLTGAYAFGLAGVYYALLVSGQDILAYILISGPSILLCTLFAIDFALRDT